MINRSCLYLLSWLYRSFISIYIYSNFLLMVRPLTPVEGVILNLCQFYGTVCDRRDCRYTHIQVTSTSSSFDQIPSQSADDLLRHGCPLGSGDSFPPQHSSVGAGGSANIPAPPRNDWHVPHDGIVIEITRREHNNNELVGSLPAAIRQSEEEPIPDSKNCKFFEKGLKCRYPCPDRHDNPDWFATNVSY
jgi:hypothetical protein